MAPEWSFSIPSWIPLQLRLCVPRVTTRSCFLAAATAVQRVVTSAHYPSDVAFGAAMGLIAAACCLGGPRAIRGTLAGHAAA